MSVCAQQKEISRTWMTRQRLPPPEGPWSTHKLPFNRLTPHLASKACWRVPEDGEGEAGPSEVSPAARSKPAAVKGRAWLNGHSHPEGDHCGGTMPHFLLQNNRDILFGPVATNICDVEGERLKGWGETWTVPNVMTILFKAQCFHLSTHYLWRWVCKGAFFMFEISTDTTKEKGCFL